LVRLILRVEERMEMKLESAKLAVGTVGVWGARRSWGVGTACE
jgi:hypothetical protein